MLDTLRGQIIHLCSLTKSVEAQRMKEFVKIVSGGVLCEFLEVAFHLILYVREVYPAVVFERRKKYNVPVQVWCPIFCQLLRLRKIPLIATYHGKLFFYL